MKSDRETFSNQIAIEQSAEPITFPRAMVFCRSGIHTGHFPIAGLRVGDVRESLSLYLNFDDQALAKVNSNVVGEDYVLGEEVALLNFMKPWKLDG